MNPKPALRVALAGVLLAITVCTASPSPPGSGPTIELKIAHEESDADVQGLYASRFEELIEDRTNGRVQVETYAAGQLGPNDDYLKMVEDGAIHAAISTPSITGSIISENQVLSIPFVFSDDMAVNHEVLNEDLASIYRQRGIEVLSYWTEGFMAWTSNRPLNEPPGMQNLRIRTMTSPMLINS